MLGYFQRKVFYLEKSICDPGKQLQCIMIARSPLFPLERLSHDVEHRAVSLRQTAELFFLREFWLQLATGLEGSVNFSMWGLQECRRRRLSLRRTRWRCHDCAWNSFASTRNICLNANDSTSLNAFADRSLNGNCFSWPRYLRTIVLSCFMCSTHLVTPNPSSN